VQIPTIKFTYADRSIELEELILWVLKPLFVLFIYFAVFGRNVIIMGIGGGLASVLLGFAVFALTAMHFVFFRKEQRVSQLTYMVILFFILIAVKPFLSYLIYDTRPNQVLRYAIEIGVNFGMLFATYYLIRNKIVSPKFFLYAFGIMGLIVSVQLVVNLVGMTVVRRVAGLRGALNYTASTLAMCAIVWAMIIYSFNTNTIKNGSYKRYFAIFAFVIVLLGVIITGSRAALLSLLIGLFLLQVFGMKSRKFTRYVLVFSMIIFGFLLYIAMNIDMSLLLNRFTYQELVRMAVIRGELYWRSVADMTFVEFMFGRADLYTFDDSVVEAGRTVNTHNIFLSFIRYNGIVAFFMFLLILYVIFAIYLRLYAKNKSKPKIRLTESSIMVLLVMALIYSMFSGGRTTRIFVVFIQIGFAMGYLEMLRTVKSEEEYKKLIL
jgi:hypothetical protein